MNNPEKLATPGTLDKDKNKKTKKHNTETKKMSNTNLTKNQSAID